MLLFLLLLSPPTALACRFNVRDVGFVDLEAASYQLCLFTGPEADADTLSFLQQMPAMVLRDCNVRFELVPASAATNHPAFRYLTGHPWQPTSVGSASQRGRTSVATEDPPARAVLISPDGQALPLTPSPRGQPSREGPDTDGRGTEAAPEPGRARLLPSRDTVEGTTVRQEPRPATPRFRENLATMLGEVASSPKRDELVAAASRSFAAVLLIEGEAADANRRAREAVAQAIEAIRGQMRSLPKAIAEPPALVVMEAAALAGERILLWSLGLDTARTAQPRAAIVYGRARWMGPLMNGDEISEPNLTGLLSIIGADCECGLDVAWTLGTRLPVRWDEARHAQVARALGFDPESPLVKVEVGRIAARSGVPRATSGTDRGIVLSSDPSTTGGDRPMNPWPRTSVGSNVPGGLTSAATGRASGGPRDPATATSAVLADSAPVLSRAWVFFGAMSLVVFGTGGFLLWKAGRRRP